MSKPILAITMGDPCGIGPEITAKALASQRREAPSCRPLVVGSAAVLRKAIILAGAELEVRAVAQAGQARYEAGRVDVLDQDLIDADALVPGVVSAQAGNAAYQAVCAAVDLAMAGQVHAVITGPLNKEALNLAVWRFSGHTEIFAQRTGTRQYAMMLAHGDFRVTHVSTHVSLREACDRCKKERILQVIRLSAAACRDLGINRPRIAVAALNPHAGEGGLFGREEIEEITPAISLARAEGLDAQGPFPADTVFSRAIGGLHDIVVAQYHDQGHIPMKVQGFRYDREKQAWSSVDGVNITLGLPIIRSSVDHGTAFDQAWQGRASHGSMLGAIDYGIRLAKSKFSL